MRHFLLVLSLAACSQKQGPRQERLSGESQPSPPADNLSRRQPPVERVSDGPARKERVNGDTYVYIDKNNRQGYSELWRVYDQANELLVKGDLAGARALYTKLAEQEPEKPLAWLGLGTCALDEHDYPLAQSYYEKAAALDSRYAPAEVGLGSVASRTGDERAAAEHYEKAVALDPANADAHWGAALAWARLGDRERARSHARVFIALAPTSTLVPRAREIMLR